MQSESLRGKIERFTQDIEKYVSQDLTAFQKMAMFADFIYEYKFHNVYLQDYIQYEFYKKKSNERKTFIVHGKLLQIMRVCNNPEHRAIFDEKTMFNQVFQDYIGREWINMQSADLLAFKTFIQNKSRIFVKDPAGMFGKGVDLIDTSKIANVEKLYEELKAKNALCEEVLEQCEETGTFNTTSANTMRVVTLVCADGSVKVMAGVMRIGRKGKFADNFHHNGIAALIDVETGLVKTVGVDREFKRYVAHPDSGIPIVGFRIPEWNKIIETVTAAAKVVPDMRYIGWDVAVNKEHQVVLIEGNPGADPDVTQIPDQVGKWPLFEPYLKQIEALK